MCLEGDEREKGEWDVKAAVRGAHGEFDEQILLRMKGLFIRISIKRTHTQNKSSKACICAQVETPARQRNTPEYVSHFPRLSSLPALTLHGKRIHHLRVVLLDGCKGRKSVKGGHETLLWCSFSVKRTEAS